MTVYEYNTILNDLRLPILKESAKYTIDGRKQFTSPYQVAELAINGIGLADATEEYIYIFVTDTKNKLIGLFECGHGTINSSLFDIRGMFQKILMLGGTGFFVTHNHPSGDPTASPEDISVTGRIKAGAELLGLSFMDHVIIGNHNYISMLEEGRL